ncbi:uncharacterized protein BDZ99DRAFT_153655 [Mytilinidion resinicola]|uniref:Uncharacterized protein n=1 Tax=Mytilinidion resinicola TaxID=574789 RepID=A0A6A6Y5T4_9PEZI|nr:uncharacterized protein BDZ99DRAFT_153655 [Mytilinidion resinicola]KAF2804152.1 hypothetical protein BDZ99DRAFT_153655 [Mytilinidion resinicola]
MIISTHRAKDPSWSIIPGTVVEVVGRVMNRTESLGAVDKKITISFPGVEAGKPGELIDNLSDDLSAAEQRLRKTPVVEKWRVVLAVHCQWKEKKNRHLEVLCGEERSETSQVPGYEKGMSELISDWLQRGPGERIRPHFENIGFEFENTELRRKFRHMNIPLLELDLCSHDATVRSGSASK